MFGLEGSGRRGKQVKITRIEREKGRILRRIEISDIHSKN